MILYDSGAFVAFSSVADPRHPQAIIQLKILREGGMGRAVTTDLILAESYTLARFRYGHRALSQLVDVLAKSLDLQVLTVEGSQQAAALELMLDRQDKHWSYVDCTSFVVMEDLGIEDAFTFDHNFAQAGFSIHPDSIE